MKIEKADRIVFFLAALLLVAGNGLVVYRNYQTEWRHYQSGYLELARDKADNPQVKAMLTSRKVRIEQQIVRQFGEQRVDRCVTCHAGVDNPRFLDAPPPFRTHPQVPGEHSLREFGCTSCHAGNGRGLSVEDAHGESEFWTEPLLKGDYIEAGCAKCHPAPYLEETPRLRMGARLFKEKACYGCHAVESVSDGKLGVELTEVGRKWGIDYLVESIVDPRANNFESLMPKMDLTEEEVKALTIYLKSLRREDLVHGSVAQYIELRQWHNREPEEVPVSVESGKLVFESKGCVACHTINGVGGKVGPDLSVYGLQRTGDWIEQHHLDPRSLIGGSSMPDFKYSASELESVTLYLLAQKKLSVDNAAIYGSSAGQ